MASSAPASSNPGDAADAAVTALIAGLKQGRPEAFWEFLPADFQDDLNGLLHQFAGRMDSELWEKTVSLFRKLAGGAQVSEAIPGGGRHPPSQSQAIGRPKGTGTEPGSAPATADWAKLADMLETVLDSDLASLERLKTADGGKLLATAGGKVIEQLKTLLAPVPPDDDFAFSLDRLGELQVSIVHTSSDAATLKFEAPEETPLVIKFVRHQGKWIPEDLENEWPHRIGNARAWLSRRTLNPESIAEQKATVIWRRWSRGGRCGSIKRGFAAKSLQEFAVAGQHATLTLLSLFAVLSGPPQTEENSAGESQPIDSKEVVTVVVEGTLDEDAQDALRERIKAVADDTDRAAAEITGDDETSTFKVGPVTDVEAFAKRLDFLDVTGVNGTTRTITAKPKPQVTFPGRRRSGRTPHAYALARPSEPAGFIPPVSGP